MEESYKNKGANTDMEKSKAHKLAEFIEYVPNAVVSKTIIKRATGTIILMSFDTGQEQPDKTLPFDTFLQVLDGCARITVSRIKHTLYAGMGIIIPAYAVHHIVADEPFKLLVTVIKSGYED